MEQQNLLKILIFCFIVSLPSCSMNNNAINQKIPIAPVKTDNGKASVDLHLPNINYEKVFNAAIQACRSLYADINNADKSLGLVRCGLDTNERNEDTDYSYDIFIKNENNFSSKVNVKIMSKKGYRYGSTDNEDAFIQGQRIIEIIKTNL
ncbi:MAG: hypothetical protein GX087_04535 [Desulfobulbaceae bacterium]|nr:hypothetical protein [Desulfobulbaceae bacterium]